MRKPIAKLILVLSVAIVVFGGCEEQTVPKVTTPTEEQSQTLDESKQVLKETEFHAISPCTNKTPDYGGRKAKSTVEGGVLNGRVLCGLLPEYPLDASFSGEVTVDVLLDGDGVVITAKGRNGNKVVRAAAVEAARATYFAPGILGGQSVNVRGVLIYKFDSKRGVWLPNIPL